MYVRAVPPTDLNKNTEWFTYPGVWSTYILILFFSWLIVLSLFHCTPGMAWTIVHLFHFLVSFFFLFFIRLPLFVLDLFLSFIYIHEKSVFSVGIIVKRFSFDLYWFWSFGLEIALLLIYLLVIIFARFGSS